MKAMLGELLVSEVSGASSSAKSVRVFGIDDAVASAVMGVEAGTLCSASALGDAELFAPGTVLYGWQRPDDAVAAIAPCHGAALPELIALRPDPQKVDASFLRHVLRSEAFVDFAMRTRERKRTREAFRSRLLECPVSVPPLPRQRTIASRLDRLERLEADQLLVLAGIERAQTELFEAAFGDPLRNPRRFPTRTLSEATRRRQSRAEAHEPTMAVRLRDIGVGFIAYEALETREPAEGDVACEPGDVLIAPMGSPVLRAAALAPRLPNASVTKQAVVVRVDESLLRPDFLASLLNHPSVVEAAHRQSSGASVRRVPLQWLFTLDVPLPPLDQQAAFATKLAASEAIATHAAHAAQALQEAALALDPSFVLRASAATVAHSA
jgi:type I restriction enzyme S subunit